jgi:hypothetical protein
MVFGKLLQVIVLLSCLLSSGLWASELCRESARAFVTSPTRHGLLTLSGSSADACWSIIGMSNDNLNQLNSATKNGNRWAALYLGEHLKKLDGGNLEDSLRALGGFSDHNMKQLIIYANEGKLSEHEFTDALSMLPLSMSDDPIAQSKALKSRRDRVTKISESNLSKQKAMAITALDAALSQIKLTHP